MDSNNFLNKFQEQFIDADEITVTMDTKFRSLPSWDSLTGMSVLVMVEDEFEVGMKDIDLKACNTVQDVYNFIVSKKNS